MTKPELNIYTDDALSPLLLAEDIDLGILEEAFVVVDHLEPESKNPHFEMERSSWKAGLTLDMALHPGTDDGLAEDYFEDVSIYVDRQLEDPFVSMKKHSLDLNARLLKAHVPSFMCRRSDQRMAAQELDAHDLASATILEDVLKDPQSPDELKSLAAARIGTQLLFGSVSIQLYPSTAREAMSSVPSYVTPERRQLGHSYYAIDADGNKTPVQSRMHADNMRHQEGHVLAPFGTLAQLTLEKIIPEMAQRWNPTGSGLLVAGWLIEMAKDDEMDDRKFDVIHAMADKLLSKLQEIQNPETVSLD